MLENIENVRIISSFRKDSKLEGSIKLRATHGFIFKIKGFTEYVLEGKSYILSEGEVIFLPKGSSYDYRSNTDGKRLYTSINFDADIENPKMAVYSLKDFYSADFFTESFSELWKFGNSSEKYECISEFYKLLSYISRIEHLTSLDKAKFDRLNPAIEFMKANIYNPELKVDKLNRLCGISDTYFRKLFNLKYKVSPRDYLVNMRLSHAKSIIESADYENICSIALSVGYTDPLYFSKAFKKRYGISPSDINK